MKNVKWLMLGLFLIYVAGCSSSSGGGIPDNAGNNTSSEDSGITTDNSNDSRLNINIPSRNESVPSGILEQLAWGGKGGPYGQKCGDCEVELHGDSIKLINFAPSQSLNLFFYRFTGSNACNDSTAEYVTTSTIRVDKNGDLDINLAGNVDDIFIVHILDADNGSEQWRSLKHGYEYIECSNNSNSSSACSGAPPQRLEVGEMAYVCTASETVKLRDDAGKDYPILKSLVPGADLKVIGGPKCADNWSWWQVETESGYTGWMSEGGDSVDTYFLCPSQ